MLLPWAIEKKSTFPFLFISYLLSVFRGSYCVICYVNEMSRVSLLFNLITADYFYGRSVYALMIDTDTKVTGTTRCVISQLALPLKPR